MDRGGVSNVLKAMWVCCITLVTFFKPSPLTRLAGAEGDAHASVHAEMHDNWLCHWRPLCTLLHATQHAQITTTLINGCPSTDCRQEACQLAHINSGLTGSTSLLLTNHNCCHNSKAHTAVQAGKTMHQICHHTAALPYPCSSTPHHPQA